MRVIRKGKYDKKKKSNVDVSYMNDNKKHARTIQKVKQIGNMHILHIAVVNYSPTTVL